MSGCFGRWRGMKKSGRCEEREGRQQGRSIARATRGLSPSLDARSLAQPCYLPEEQHRPLEGERKRLKDSPTRQVTTCQIGRRRKDGSRLSRVLAGPHDETVVARCAQSETVLPLCQLSRFRRPQSSSAIQSGLVSSPWLIATDPLPLIIRRPLMLPFFRRLFPSCRWHWSSCPQAPGRTISVPGNIRSSQA
jgi:hypothetical protein